MVFMVRERLVHAQEPNIYWIGAVGAEETRGNAIFRYAPGSSVVDTLVQASELSSDESRFFFYVTVDTLNGQVYWTDSGGTNADGVVELGAIMRMSLDGSNPDVFLSPIACGTGSPNDIEFDAAGETVYWGEGSDCSDVGLNALKLGQQDSGQDHGLPMSANYSVSAIEIDAPNNAIYWVNRDFFAVEPDGILRAPLTDTASDEYVVVGSVCDMAVVHGIAKMYWTTCGSGAIRRANLDGSGVEAVLESGAEVGKLAVDERAGKIYWTETAAGTIRRANLDGTEVEDVLSGLAVPGSIAVMSGSEIHTGNELDEAFPTGAGLVVRVYPNPVHAHANIEFTLAAPSHVTLELFDPLGRQVTALSSRVYPAGASSEEWDLAHLSGGVYFIRVTSEFGSKTVPLIVRR